MNRREFVQGVVGATTVNNSFLAFAVQSKPPRQIAYYLDQSAGPAAAFGVQAIERACEKKGVGLRRVQVIDDTLADYLLVISCRSDQASPVRQLSTQLGAPSPYGKESFVIQSGMVGNKNIALVCGADALALAYALYSIADLIWTVLSSQYSITQRSPVNPNGYRSARIGPGFSSVWGPIGKRRKILGWWHGERLRQPVLMAGALGSWF